METDPPMNEQESLLIIQKMISRTQGKVGDNGFFFLLWGWLVFAASVGQYVLIKLGYPNQSSLTWAILMPAGGIISTIAGKRRSKREQVKTYTGELLKYVGIAFMVALFIVLVFSSYFGGWELAYPMIMMVYGMWLFISGGALKFRPLIIGGIIDWCCSIAGFYIHTYELILLLSFAVLAGYIVPGHLLNAKYKRENNEAV
ncbi:MAG: hypothetical protein HY064_08915 [Bacteroidetes bacterium]|nr:hypothetical protein [Bacteroidota bacterium]